MRKVVGVPSSWRATHNGQLHRVRAIEQRVVSGCWRWTPLAMPFPKKLGGRLAK